MQLKAPIVRSKEQNDADGVHFMAGIVFHFL